VDQKKETRKRTWRRGPQERTRESKPWTLREFGGKTVWDWLQLLIVPVMLLLVPVGFTLVQDARQQQIAEQRAQDEALQAYLDQMSTLLLEKDLRNAKEGSEVLILARARTVTVMQGLDAEGNRNVVRFLAEAGLTGVGQSSLSLLEETDLSGVDLSGANLTDADLRDALLLEAELLFALLRDANLSGADLYGANLTDADLTNADLSGAYLSGANLSGAYLSGADLSGAYLSEANLRYTTLDEADLRGAEGVTQEQLAQASSLEGATMPNGQKYEDWLKSKGSVEAGENSGAS
jgi:uncharacterized protein YjbI with pentapeptide repeats